ncbi:PspC domain-containing protein [Roseiflexus sp.]|uniref:PspC domain-containing protein n=1 Tax=Roseiflexus sp. TaxID=2562120 RepID=UPI00398B818C
MNASTLRLMRSRDDAIIAGVAGGIARYLEVDPTIVRLIFVLLVFSGVGVLLYPVLWIIMPLEGTSAPGRTADDSGREPFVRGGSAQRRQPDPLNSADGDFESEIPVNNLNDHNTRHASPPVQRSGQLGVILIGVGILALLSIFLGPAFGKLLFPIVLIAAGALVLLRNRQ